MRQGTAGSSVICRKIIAEESFTSLCLIVIKDASRILRGYHLSDPRMDERSLLLMVLYDRLRQSLGMKPKEVTLFPENPTHEWTYRVAFTKLFEVECQMDPRFDYDLVIDQFLEASLKRIGN